MTTDHEERPVDVALASATEVLEVLYVVRDDAGARFLAASEKAVAKGARAMESAFARGVLRIYGRRTSSEELGLGRNGPPPPPRGLVIIHTLSLSRPAERALREFAVETRLGHTTDWLVTDGRSVLSHSGGVTVAPHSVVRSTPSGRPAPSPSPSGYSDRFLACAKAVFFSGSRREWAPTPELAKPIHDARELADRLGSEGSWWRGDHGVSLPHAYRFAKSYRRLGHLVDDDVGLLLHRREDLFDAWATRIAPQNSNAIRAKTRAPSLDAWFKTHQLIDAPETRWAVGAHHAARLWGAPAVGGAPLTIYIDGTPDHAADLLDLDIEPAIGANVLLVQPKYRRSVFGPWLSIREGVPVSDILQCYLDLLQHPLRGHEAAEELAAVVPELCVDARGG